MAMAKFGGFTAAEPQHRAASHVMLFFFVVVELSKAQKSRTKEPHQDQRAPYFPQGYSAVPMRRRGETCLHSVGWELYGGVTTLALECNTFSKSSTSDRLPGCDVRAEYDVLSNRLYPLESHY
ncbi:hypothetical protein BDBG_06617 [Blastomyces gilchristii SLH14081]|uniref:Uncharacterized protein n=1 Tax=Blastomyces gilchristii (strain SLH14081) TaxID=559298 RepID=A0A179UUS0_BLAGS|nr:uncharacterized protein BDBG_06617 [Blastomyces gilchristii SLH14081]OAT10827.1 hypothetical protein BDBG_06617 [Blastomyces gilchristii SLH14081]